MLKKLPIPRLLGDRAHTDTQAVAALKDHQEWVFIGGVLVVLFIVVSTIITMMEGRTGTWRFSICHVFLEQYDRFPGHIKITEVAEKQASAEIRYLSTNPYGTRQAKSLECFYNFKAEGVQLSTVTLNDTPLDQKLLDQFNPTIKTIFTREDLKTDIPDVLSLEVQDLKIE